MCCTCVRVCVVARCPDGWVLRLPFCSGSCMITCLRRGGRGSCCVYVRALGLSVSDRGSVCDLHAHVCVFCCCACGPQEAGNAMANILFGDVNPRCVSCAPLHSCAHPLLACVALLCWRAMELCLYLSSPPRAHTHTRAHSVRATAASVLNARVRVGVCAGDRCLTMGGLCAC